MMSFKAPPVLDQIDELVNLEGDFCDFGCKKNRCRLDDRSHQRVFSRQALLHLNELVLGRRSWTQQVN